MPFDILSTFHLQGTVMSVGDTSGKEKQAWSILLWSWREKWQIQTKEHAFTIQYVKCCKRGNTTF